MSPSEFENHGFQIILGEVQRPVSWELTGVARELATSLRGFASVHDLGVATKLEGDRAGGILTKEGNAYRFDFDHPHIKLEVIEMLQRTLFRLGAERLSVEPNLKKVVQKLRELEPTPPLITRTHGSLTLPPVSVTGILSLDQYEPIVATVRMWDQAGGARTATAVTPIYVIPVSARFYTRTEPVRRQEVLGEVTDLAGPAYRMAAATASASLTTAETLFTGTMLQKLPGSGVHEFAHHLWEQLRLFDRPNNPMGKGDLTELSQMGYDELRVEDYARVHERFFELLPRLLAKPSAWLYNPYNEQSDKLRFVLTEAYGVPLPPTDPGNSALRALLRQHFPNVPRNPDDEAQRGQLRRNQSELSSWLYHSTHGANRRRNLDEFYGIKLPDRDPGAAILRNLLDEFIA